MTGRIALAGCLAFLAFASTVAVVEAADAPERTIMMAREFIASGHDGRLTRLAGKPLKIVEGRAQGTLGTGCTYRDIAGVATVVRVTRTGASSQQAAAAGGPGYEGVEVRFSFAPGLPISEPSVRGFVHATHVLRLVNSWYPGPRYVEKYHLTEGGKIPAVLRVRTSGACTPMLFSFPAIDLADYFESAH